MISAPAATTSPMFLRLFNTFVLSIVTARELLYGAFNKRELNQISKDINLLHVIHISQSVGECFIKLMNQYALSHRLSLPDGLIAATSLVEKIPLYTHNLKDFKFIENLELYKEKV